MQSDAASKSNALATTYVKPNVGGAIQTLIAFELAELDDPGIHRLAIRLAQDLIKRAV
jgi:hypothetical protein